MGEQLKTPEQQIQIPPFGIGTLNKLKNPTIPTSEDFGVNAKKISTGPQDERAFGVRMDGLKNLAISDTQLLGDFNDNKTQLGADISSALASVGETAPMPDLNLKSSLASKSYELADFASRIQDGKTYKPESMTVYGVSLENFLKIKKGEQIDPQEAQKYRNFFNDYGQTLTDIFGNNGADIAKQLSEGTMSVDQVRGKIVEKINTFGTIEEKLQYANRLLMLMDNYYDQNYTTQFKNFSLSKGINQFDALSKTLDPKEYWQGLLSGKMGGVCRDAHSEVAAILSKAGLEAYSASVDAGEPHVITMVKNGKDVYLLDWGTTIKTKSFKEAFSFYEQKGGIFNSGGHFVVDANGKPKEIVTTDAGEGLKEIVGEDFFSTIDGTIDSKKGKSISYSANFDKNNKLVSVDFDKGKWHFDADAISKNVNGTQFLAGKLGTEYSINDMMAVFASISVGEISPDQLKHSIDNPNLDPAKKLNFLGFNTGFRGHWNLKTYQTSSGTTNISANAGALAHIDGESDILKKPKNPQIALAASFQAGGEVVADYSSNDGKLKIGSKIGYMSEIFPSQGGRTAALDGVVINNSVNASTNLSYDLNATNTLYAQMSGNYNSLRPDEINASLGLHSQINERLSSTLNTSVNGKFSSLDGNIYSANAQAGLEYQLDRQNIIGGGIGVDATLQNRVTSLSPYVYGTLKHIMENGTTLNLGANASKTGFNFKIGGSGKF